MRCLYVYTSSTRASILYSLSVRRPRSLRLPTLSFACACASFLLALVPRACMRHSAQANYRQMCHTTTSAVYSTLVIRVCETPRHPPVPGPVPVRCGARAGVSLYLSNNNTVRNASNTPYGNIAQNAVNRSMHAIALDYAVFVTMSSPQPHVICI